MKNTPKEDIDYGKRYARTQFSFLNGKIKNTKRYLSNQRVKIVIAGKIFGIDLSHTPK